MDKNRLWVIGTALVIVAIVLLGWVLGISPKLTEASTAQAELAAATSENAVHEVQGETLKKQFEGLGALKADLAALQLSVPSSAEFPALITELNAISEASQVVISSITQNDAQAYDPTLAGVAVAAPAPSTESGTSEVAPAPSEATAAVAGAPAAPVVDPRITAANFAAIPVTFVVDGSAAGVLDFVSGIQHGERLIMVTAVSMSEPANVAGVEVGVSEPASDTGVVTGSITAFIYVLTTPTTPAAAQ
ncbi:hypothetical protein [Cryobacterium psychrophilum]|uniref:Pilus assembly protein PilO n=1 Tax=Cryobacterium psychrophilum TaxID=41988 RepID=A0A4Y8KUR2_9MICO|nr:hypothetical protein [Cryobacterium psychrophilum]TDW29726.1 hypothetical protein EDD25_1436 [Cryobacterium psychrophilum]TFD81832.1 hypothetical protein E3T53_02250 [Cryobacterium psychrophilum]